MNSAIQSLPLRQLHLRPTVSAVREASWSAAAEVPEPSGIGYIAAIMFGDALSQLFQKAMSFADEITDFQLHKVPMISKAAANHLQAKNSKKVRRLLTACGIEFVTMAKQEEAFA